MPPTTTDLKSAYVRVKHNFVQGRTVYEGVKRTFSDAISVVGAWTFWSSSVGQFLLGFVLTIGIFLETKFSN